MALIHDYLNQYGGAERTLEEIMDLFPDAPIYTGIYIPEKVPPKIRQRKIYSAKAGPFSGLSKYFTFLMPFVFERFDLSEYDLIISDGTAWPKGVLTKPDQLHIAYIHTPPRFLYGYTVESTKRNAWYFKPFVAVIDLYLKTWDYAAAQRPDIMLANSKEIKKRIQKFYKRDVQVIYPPVEVNHPVKSTAKFEHDGPYYLALGRLSAFKNFDVLIKAFENLDLKLVIVGTGIEEKRLKKMAGAANGKVTLTGNIGDDEKHAAIAGCRGLINAVADEDFGIVPVEVMGHGKPTLAHKSSGHLETVTEGVSGMFFESLDPQKLAERIKEFDTAITKGKFDAKKIKQTAQKFSRERFKKEFKETVDREWKKFNA